MSQDESPEPQPPDNHGAPSFFIVLFAERRITIPKTQTRLAPGILVIFANIIEIFANAITYLVDPLLLREGGAEGSQ